MIVKDHHQKTKNNLYLHEKGPDGCLFQGYLSFIEVKERIKSLKNS